MGFVTAAHRGPSFFTIGTIFRANNPSGPVLGSIRNANDIAINRDAAFVTLDSQAQVNNFLPSGTLGAFFATPIQGAAVMNLSYTQPNGMNFGWIRNPSDNVNINGASVNIVTVDFARPIMQGDSGGLIYIESSGNVHPVAGIIVARLTANHHIGFYVRADLILSSLGLTLH